MRRKVLSWSKLEEVLPDVKINMKNRPIAGKKEDIQHTILTANKIILGRDTKMVEENKIEDNKKRW